MDKIIIEGGTSLKGSITVSGAKNACLTLMPTALLSTDPLTLTNVPQLADITTMSDLLRSLGCEAASLQNSSVLIIGAQNIKNTLAHYEIVRKMRASILVLGPLLARVGHATVSLPGGCAIGARPVDLHINVLEAMNATFDLKDGYIKGKAPKGLKGCHYTFPLVSVGATENALMAATLAKGETRLDNCACEPEIVDLATCLQKMGAKIEGAGTSTILIQGKTSLHGATHSVLPDRIELGTYMIAAAMTGGTLEFPGVTRPLIQTLIDVLQKSGVKISDTKTGIEVSCQSTKLSPLNITTAPFPGFPTDLQAQTMAMSCLIKGESHIEERIFENRFMHVPELKRMGADININGNNALIRGVDSLRGAPIMATDLRASISLILAGLVAKGQTVVHRVYHLDRGYERVEDKLSSCGAKICREPDDKDISS